jgi:hypothetical protein
LRRDAFAGVPIGANRESSGGELLERLLSQWRPFLRLALGLAGAVAGLHQQGLIHKDIKPAHLLVDRASGAVHLTGFGIASRLPRQRQAPDPPAMIAGTLPRGRVAVTRCGRIARGRRRSGHRPHIMLAAGNGRGKNEFRPERGTGVGMSWSSMKGRLRSLIFRALTACAILAAYVFGWLYVPEMLTWWKRTTTTIIEAGCNLLPYPWGDRIEATLGNFGLWVQITLAITVFRMLMWLVISALRRMWATRDRRPDHVLPLPARR